MKDRDQSTFFPPTLLITDEPRILTSGGVEVTKGKASFIRRSLEEGNPSFLATSIGPKGRGRKG